MTLRSLNKKSIPINFLNPIEGTPLAHLNPLSEDEIKKSVAIMRFILPDAFLRLAGGRGLLPSLGHDLFECGINASLTGDLLTTPGISIECDLEKIKSLNLEVKRYD
jgi:biotin synthase